VCLSPSRRSAVGTKIAIVVDASGAAAGVTDVQQGRLAERFIHAIARR
jgi:hypothetical protein